MKELCRININLGVLILEKGGRGTAVPGGKPDHPGKRVYKILKYSPSMLGLT